jgi:hypothetical protein
MALPAAILFHGPVASFYDNKPLDYEDVCLRGKLSHNATEGFG